MVKINSIDYTRFGNENYLQFSRETCSIIEQYGVIGQRFGYLVTAYLAAVEELDEAMKKPTWSDLTEPIAKKDDARDKVLISFKAMVESQRYFSPTEGVTLAAEKVYRFIKLNHANPAAQYDKETAQISNLLQDLERYCQAEVVLMGVQPMLTELKTLNDEMADLLVQRDIQDSLKRNEAVKQARSKCDKLYVALKDTVNAAALVDAEETLTEYINSINQMIKRLETQVLKTPTSSGSGSDTGSGEGGNTGSGSGEGAGEGSGETGTGGEGTGAGEGGEGTGEGGSETQEMVTITFHYHDGREVVRQYPKGTILSQTSLEVPEHSPGYTWGNYHMPLNYDMTINEYNPNEL